MGTWSTGGPEANRRRSQRVILSVPVIVAGEAAKGKFTENTKTLVVNAHGALITLAAKVTQNQELELTSPTNPEKQQCKVVYIGPTVQGQTQVGIEFLKPAPHFWHVAFPPENWTPTADEGDKTAKPPMKPGATVPAKPGVAPPARPSTAVPAPAKPSVPAKPPVPAPAKVSKP